MPCDLSDFKRKIGTLVVLLYGTLTSVLAFSAFFVFFYFGARKRWTDERTDGTDKTQNSAYVTVRNKVSYDVTMTYNLDHCLSKCFFIASFVILVFE